MKTILSYFSVAILLTFFFSSCDDDKDEPGIKAGTAVKTAESTAEFDLTNRKDWNLTLGGESYNFEIDGKTLKATSAVKSPYYFPYGETAYQTMLVLYPSSYLGKIRATGKVHPIIEDQSTKEKFINCDPLRAIFSGAVSENLKGITFKHYNALLLFNVIDLPEDAKVSVKQLYNQTITPLQDENDPTLFRAIIFPENTNPALVIEANGKTYELGIVKGTPRMTESPGLKNNTVVTFKATIDENDKLVIGDLKKKSDSSNWLELQNN